MSSGCSNLNNLNLTTRWIICKRGWVTHYFFTVIKSRHRLGSNILKDNVYCEGRPHPEPNKTGISTFCWECQRAGEVLVNLLHVHSVVLVNILICSTSLFSGNHWTYHIQSAQKDFKKHKNYFKNSFFKIVHKRKENIFEKSIFL